MHYMFFLCNIYTLFTLCIYLFMQLGLKYFLSTARAWEKLSCVSTSWSGPASREATRNSRCEENALSQCIQTTHSCFYHTSITPNDLSVLSLYLPLCLLQGQTSLQAWSIQDWYAIYTPLLAQRAVKHSKK